MLARYRIYRGKRDPDDPLPEGVRQDTRHRTSHCLRPAREMVESLLAADDNEKEAAWVSFERAYLALLEERFRDDRRPFDELARLAMDRDVYLGCNCPTSRNPEVAHCHTLPALRFMKDRYRRLKVEFPRGVRS